MDQVDGIRQVFSHIYDRDVWHGGSGPGSRPRNTAEYRAFVERFIDANDIRTVTDLGCGDWQFSRYINWAPADYTGFDIVESVVASNKTRFAQPGVDFRVLQSIDDLPGGDLLLSKEVLQHLPNAVISDYIPHIRKKYKYALLTNSTLPAEHANIDISPGQYRPLRLEAAPFSVLGAVVLTYFPHEGDHMWKNAVFLVQGE